MNRDNIKKPNPAGLDKASKLVEPKQPSQEFFNKIEETKMKRLEYTSIDTQKHAHIAPPILNLEIWYFQIMLYKFTKNAPLTLRIRTYWKTYYIDLKM